MPRTNLGRNPVEVRRENRHEAVRRIIRCGMAKRNLRQYQVAAEIGVSAPAFSKLMKNASFSFDQLCEVVRVLHLSKDDAGLMLGAK